MFLDQLFIGDTGSHEEYGASVKAIRIKDPTKKEVKETVPFSNVTYDFSMINGELYWNEREIEVDFEIMADTPEELVRKKAAFNNWVMNVFKEDIHSPFDPDYHYVGSFSKKDYTDEDNAEKTVAKVVFMVYPYKISNDPELFHFTVPANGNITDYIVNKSSHRITPTIISASEIVIQYGNTSYGVPMGETTDESFKLKTGKNELKFVNQNETPCQVTVKFYKELF